jgi:hypothetical protein
MWRGYNNKRYLLCIYVKEITGILLASPPMDLNKP